MMKKYTLLFFFIFLAGLATVSAQSDPSIRVEDSSVSIDNFILNEAVSMYPNPVERYLTIRSNFPITRVMVYSLLGDQVKDVRNNFSRIDLRDLNSGIYMIKVYSNQFFVTKKLIKK
ncbi:T9SS type A sorting domain-containing protein [Lutimonas vermicola]|uniref:T9SS type A sorting domain-containing protein n=1 Tax=Lutimonas vermicola TaxID=414288 RepID=A0ABU9L1J8_9FLAO